MKRHPPYQLRPNKAVDRLAFVDAIRRLGTIAPLKSYTYYGFGGPHLEEFRLLYEFCPQVQMVSIEEDSDTLLRQKFHLPCGLIELKNISFESFLADFSPNDTRGIFWLDYADLDYSCFAEFIGLLEKLPEDSMVKLSVRCHPSDYVDKDPKIEAKKVSDFRECFGAILPSPSVEIPRTREALSKLIQEMVEISAQKALPAATPLMFQPVSSFYYQDGVCMFTLTGIVTKRGDAELAKIQSVFSDWEFANLDWSKPKEIDLPHLSTKERLLLQEFLPSTKIDKLKEALGYDIGDSTEDTLKLLRQYALYHRYFPFFIKAAP
jgi:hypothetical protein